MQNSEVKSYDLYQERPKWEDDIIQRPDICMLANGYGNKSFIKQVQEHNTKHTVRWKIYKCTGKS